MSSAGRGKKVAEGLLQVTEEERMSDRSDDRATWAIGGGLLLGVGVGLFLLRESALAFVGSLVAGLGLGLMVTSILSSRRRQG